MNVVHCKRDSGFLSHEIDQEFDFFLQKVSYFIQAHTVHFVVSRFLKQCKGRKIGMGD